MKAIVQNISIRFRKLCLIVCCILLKNIWKTTTILPRATAPQFVNYTSQYSTANNKLSRRSGKQVSVMLRPLTLEVLPEWICLCSCNYRQGVWVPALKGWACCVGGIARPTLEHCYCLTLLTQDIHLAGVAESWTIFGGRPFVIALLVGIQDRLAQHLHFQVTSLSAVLKVHMRSSRCKGQLRWTCTWQLGVTRARKGELQQKLIFIPSALYWSQPFIHYPWHI